MSSQSQTKTDLRRWINAQIREVPKEQRALWSHQVQEVLMGNPAWLPKDGGGVVAIFGGMKLEVDVMPLFSWLQEKGCEVALFALDGDLMTPWRVRLHGDLQSGVMGVLEPLREEGGRLEIADLQVVLTPGLAFDRESGMRMGRGKGHYDRIFGDPGFRGLKIGVAFELQLITGVPSEPHDRAMDHVVTQNGWQSFK
ncbi:5-formyltetrahydrofolate cyclo-ligase [Phragmitibacter flavus]|uniref:5-formyltetrahydrofolate cyclo-ligase n=1 Tax=Phragmitibacter flavus TaxID=2576071 RepID=A0A5R8KGT3_9BACT|nr:5-formyltetrahydrofolate cyclo-ligase [Phragmitibacter flavus]TLD71457.1 5-formyltetrahydrofolate cyclo-ligase [Phragmitibacter flavus]